MKANITRGDVYKPLVQYGADIGRKGAGRKHAEYIGGTIDESSVDDIVKALLVPQKVRKVDRPVYHISLSQPPGERLTSDRWRDVIEAFLRKMGIPPDTPWIAYRHNDTPHDHVHICMSRVSLSGSLYLGQFEMLKAIQATQEIEEEFGLTRTKGIGKDRNGLTRGERRMIERTQKLSDKQLIRIQIDKALARSASMEEFTIRLGDVGIEVRLNGSRKGHISGISFSRDGFSVKGSKLGSRYSYSALSRRLPSIAEISIGYEKNLGSRTRSVRTR